MPTTTAHLQKYPDFYETKEECTRNTSKHRENSNQRYKTFCQVNFTAGDEEQFTLYRYPKNNPDEKHITIPEQNRFKDMEIASGNLYTDICAAEVTNTFKYIFHKFKKGIFVKIVNNELKVFLPFSNANFQNEWSHLIKIDPKYYDKLEYFRHITEIEGYKFNSKNINMFSNGWYANNCLIRYEYPVGETDTNIPCLKDMLTELCKHRTVPDIEFFINKRDFPLLTHNKTEPYTHIWGDNKPLVSHCYNKYAPIMSMSSNEHYSDVLIPTYDDWIRTQQIKSKYYTRASQNYPEKFDIEWDSKKPMAVFRGSSTGYGVTVKDNQRLLACKIGLDNPELIDAGITKWNVRPKKYTNSSYLVNIEPKNIPFKISKTMTPYEQSRYKYIIHIDGHTTSFRLSLELAMGSVILMVKSDWKMWYSEFLKPYVHYIPVKADLSDLVDQIKWCVNNDDACKQIANCALDFYNYYLTEDGILDHLQHTLISIKTQIGNYRYLETDPLLVQYENEKYILNNIIQPKYNTNITLTQRKRSQGYLQLIKEILNYKTPKQSEIVFKNKQSEIILCTIDGIAMNMKTSTNSLKIKEYVHEAFVALNCTNSLSHMIPNFSYVYKVDHSDTDCTMYTEHTIGRTLQGYIKSDIFSFKCFLEILVQISLALEIAQREFCFVHYDMTPWNIVIKDNSVGNITQYPILDSTYIVNSKVTPVIIDFGKSHVVHDLKQYGYMRRFGFNTYLDIVTLLITSVYEIVMNVNLCKKDFYTLLNLINFISGTKFCPDRFTNSKQLKEFLHREKKYAYLISDNKDSLSHITPMMFYEYIIGLKYDIDIGKIQGHIIHPNTCLLEYNIACYGTHGFEYTINKIKDCYGSLIKEVKDTLLLKYALKQLESDILELQKQMGRKNLSILSQIQDDLENIKDANLCEINIHDFIDITDSSPKDDIVYNAIDTQKYMQKFSEVYSKKEEIATMIDYRNIAIKMGVLKNANDISHLILNIISVCNTIEECKM